jgi:NADH-quinone oxidoreductase subunit H
MAKILLYFLIIPGFLYAAIIGLLASWYDRKLTARLQWRQGPPLYQPFADILKLLGKETFVPQGTARIIFISAPLLSLAAVTVVSAMLWLMNIIRYFSFKGDIILIVLLLMVPSLALIIGGSLSKNPLSEAGVSREKRLLLAYEIPFIIAILIAAMRSGSLAIAGIIGYQSVHGTIISSLSGAIAFLVSIFVVQAQLGFVPFDTTEAEQEIESGPMLEYSGWLLAVFKLTKAMLLFVLPMLLITLYLGGLDMYSWTNILWFIIEFIIILILLILIKNTNPRVRIDQAVRFFYGPMTVLAVIGLILASRGW